MDIYYFHNQKYIYIYIFFLNEVLALGLSTQGFSVDTLLSFLFLEGPPE